MISNAEREALVINIATHAENIRHMEIQLAGIIAECRQRGLLWDDVAAGLGVTKQAAHKRFRSSRVSLDDAPLPVDVPAPECRHLSQSSKTAPDGRRCSKAVHHAGVHGDGRATWTRGAWTDPADLPSNR